MIHIFSLHFKDDKWADIQLRSIKHYVKVPYKTYAVYSHMSKDIYDKRKTQYDYFLNKEEGLHVHKGGNYHLTDGHRDIIPLIKKHSQPGDIFLRLDSDAFIIDDIDDKFIDLVNKHKFIAVHEPQHEWDINHKTPHPSLWAFPTDFLNTNLSKAMSTLNEDKHSNWWGGVVKWIEQNNINWYSLERSNKISLHPLYYAIYGNLVYHHWAGSRNMITRPDRKISKSTGESLDKIAYKNNQISNIIYQHLHEQPLEFIKYLKGEYDGELTETDIE